MKTSGQAAFSPRRGLDRRPRSSTGPAGLPQKASGCLLSLVILEKKKKRHILPRRWERGWGRPKGQAGQESPHLSLAIVKPARVGQAVRAAPTSVGLWASALHTTSASRRHGSLCTSERGFVPHVWSGRGFGTSQSGQGEIWPQKRRIGDAVCEYLSQPHPLPA